MDFNINEIEINLGNVCRTCLCLISEQDKHVFESHDNSLDNKSVNPPIIKDMLLSFAVLKISENDGLPTQICTECIKTMVIAFEFKKQCETSENFLKQYIGSSSKQDIIVEADNSEIINNELTMSLKEIPIVIDSANYHCGKCDIFFLSLTCLEDHYNKQICGRSFSPKETNINIDPQNDNAFLCEICSESFTLKHLLEEHFNKIHSIYKDGYVCITCGKVLSTRAGMYTHMKIHNGEKNHVCNICGKKLLASNALKVHMRVHTRDKPFKCDYENCNKMFSTKCVLQRHYRVHTGEKPYKCIICDKTFSTSYNYQMHQRAHTQEKPETCTLCGKNFVNTQSLKKHMRLHTGERPYSCKFCNEKFVSSSAVSTHVKIKHMEKQHECNICHKQFHLATVLRKHKDIHSGKKPYSCHECGSSFAQNAGLYQHMRTHNKSSNKEKIISE